jgi:transcriptional regulator with XRE-family HTH domain
MTTPTPPPVRRASRDIGESLAAWRRLRGLTEAQVADRAGVSRATVQRLSRDPASVSVENLLRVARALGVMDEIVRSLDPMSTDVGRMRAEERLPKRVRHARPKVD